MDSIPWVEKYRPRVAGDLVVDEVTRKKIESFIEKKEIPNLLISGVPGVGKTSTILCLARQLLGKYAKDGVLELNASDDRGLKAVQEPIINFCKKRLYIEEEDEYAKHKIILLDEADNMTKKAQQQINTLMETYHKTARFALTCNNSTGIITAIKSHCCLMRYRRLGHEQIEDRLRQVANIEKVDYTTAGLREIARVSCGDLRQAINNLQLIHTGFGKVKKKYVDEFCERPNPRVITDIFATCAKGDLGKAIVELEGLEKMGYCGSDIVYSMANSLENDEIDCDEKTKIELMQLVTRSQMAISRGVDTKLQLSGCLAAIYRYHLQSG